MPKSHCPVEWWNTLRHVKLGEVIRACQAHGDSRGAELLQINAVFALGSDDLPGLVILELEKGFGRQRFLPLCDEKTSYVLLTSAKHVRPYNAPPDSVKFGPALFDDELLRRANSRPVALRIYETPEEMVDGLTYSMRKNDFLWLRDCYALTQSWEKVNNL